MIIQKCDICGRIEGLKMLEDDGETRKTLTFTSAPFKIQVRNYKGEDYNAYIDIGVQKTADSNTLKKAYDQLQNSKNSFEDLLTCLDSSMGNNGTNKPRGMPIKVDNPYSSVCDECKHKLVEKILKKEFTHDLF